MNRYNTGHQPAHFDLASSAFQRALSLDSKLADAAGQMAMLLRFKWDGGGAPADQLLSAIEKWANHALSWAGPLMRWR